MWSQPNRRWNGDLAKTGTAAHKSCFDCEHARVGGFPMSKCVKHPEVGRVKFGHPLDENGKSMADACKDYRLCYELEGLAFKEGGE